MEKHDCPTHRVYEVEQKYYARDINELLARLEQLAMEEHAQEHHQDIYFRHPSRNFRETDEALRIRVLGDRACVTYKGPRLAGPVKTRPEIELDIRSSETEHWSEMYQHLGFTIAAEVRKTRRIFQPRPGVQVVGNGPIVVALDDVEQLGSFAEIEQIVSDPNELETAKETIQDVASRLGLAEVQPVSYLGMLLAKLGIE
ncbi:MAG: class IV adenylate cyclase [Aureliella sp.]